MNLEKNLSRKDESNQSDSENIGDNSIKAYSQPEAEKKFTKEEYLSIIEGAEFFRDFEARKGKISQDIVSRLSEEENIVPLSRVYRLAEDLGIDRQYVDRYLGMRFPSENQKIEDLKRFGAMPNKKTIIEGYKTNLQTALISAFPNEKFIFEEGYEWFSIKRIEKKFKRKGIFFKKNKLVDQESDMATLLFFPYNLKVYDPCFLRACGETLEKLNKAYNTRFESVIYNYPVNFFK